MLRTNLSTRPFYNERGVRAGLAVLVLLTAALTAFNAATILSLTGENREAASRAEASESKAAQLREQARVIRQALNREEVDAVQAAAREANMLIDRRAFSWTDLFNRFEETLPAEVRIVAVQPQIDSEGRMLVAVTVIARSVEHLNTFIDRLEETGAFKGILPRQQDVMEDGSLRSVIQGYYGQRSGGAAVPSPPASEKSEAEAGNATPRNAAESGPRAGDAR